MAIRMKKGKGITATKNKVETNDEPTVSSSKPDQVSSLLTNGVLDMNIRENDPNKSGKTFGRVKVETLLPDPQNPRPDFHIDRKWLERHVLLGTDEQLIKVSDKEDDFDPVTGESKLLYVPKFNELVNDPPERDRDDYEELRELAYSLANDGQIQNIEIAERTPGELHVVVGHMRRLASLLGGRRFLWAVFDANISRATQKQIALRQLTENNLRKNYTLHETYILVSQYYEAFPDNEKPNKEEIAKSCKLNRGNYSKFFEVVMAGNHGDNNVPIELVQCIKNDVITLSKLNKIMAFKQFARRQKEAQKLLGGETKVKPPRSKKKSYSWNPTPNQASKVSKILIEHFPDLKSAGVEAVESEDDFKKLFNALVKIAEKANG